MGKKRRLLIADPGFTRATGHHLSTAVMLGEACARHGIECELFAGRHLRRATPRELETLQNLQGINAVNCVFSEAVFSYGMKSLDTREAAEVHIFLAGMLAGDMERYLTPALDENTVILCHSVSPAYMYAFSIWLRGMPPEKRPRVLCNVQVMHGETDSRRQLFTAGIRSLDGLETVRLFASNVPIASRMAAYTGKPFRLLPVPLPVAEKIDRTHAAPVFCVAGESRFEKNLHILPGAIERYIEGGGKGSFSIQLFSLLEEMRALTESVLPALQRLYPGRIHFVNEPLYGEAYTSHIARCDAMLLPYAVSYYLYRISQVAVEAAALGLACITTAGSSMEEELVKLNNGSVFMQGETEEDLAESLFTFEREFEARRDLAAAGQKACAAFHNVDAYLDIVFDMDDVYVYPDFARVSPPELAAPATPVEPVAPAVREGETACA